MTLRIPSSGFSTSSVYRIQEAGTCRLLDMLLDNLLCFLGLFRGTEKIKVSSSLWWRAKAEDTESAVCTGRAEAVPTWELLGHPHVAWPPTLALNLFSTTLHRLIHASNQMGIVDRLDLKEWQMTKGHETLSRPSVASTFMYRCGSVIATTLELKADVGQCEHCFVTQEWPGGLSWLTASIGVSRGS